MQVRGTALDPPRPARWEKEEKERTVRELKDFLKPFNFSDMPYSHHASMFNEFPEKENVQVNSNTHARTHAHDQHAFSPLQAKHVSNPAVTSGVSKGIPRVTNPCLTRCTTELHACLRGCVYVCVSMEKSGRACILMCVCVCVCVGPVAFLKSISSLASLLSFFSSPVW